MVAWIQYVARRTFWKKSLLSLTAILLMALSGLATSFYQTGSTLNCRLPMADCRQASEIRSQVIETYGTLPLTFEANQGQTDDQVKFLARGNGYTMFLTSTEAVLALSSPQSPQRAQREISSSVSASSAISAVDSIPAAVLRMKLVGANLEPQVTGRDGLPGKSHYFVGNDPAKWRTDVPTYSRVKHQDVYPGIDLVYYGNQRQLEYDFIVAPGANPSDIALSFEGADDIEVDAQGDLVLHFAGEEIRQPKPLIYQEVNGARVEVGGEYKLLNPESLSADRQAAIRLPVGRHGHPQHVVGFRLGAYDVARPVTIDPVLVYSTFLGSTQLDQGNDIAVDSAGNAYVTGVTGSTLFPIVGPVQDRFGGGDSDAFVMKVNADGNQIVYSTFFGGVFGDTGTGIAVDAAGNAYVVGATGSPDFPTVSPLQRALAGSVDAFVAKLNPAGDVLLYSTYLGGRDADNGTSIAVDLSRNAYVTGNTTSDDFPTANAFQPNFGGGTRFFGGDAFVAKLNGLGSALIYSTYLGGTSDDSGQDIAVDTAGSAYVIGETYSTDFPTANPLQATNRGSQDAFVAKFDGTGSVLVYSTYVGGSDFDRGLGIVVGSSNDVFITGFTNSNDLITSPRTFQAALRGLQDAYVARLNAAGAARVYATYLGGSDEDQALSIAVDTNGNAYVTGVTISTDFPRAGPLQLALEGDHDVFVTKLTPDGEALLYSTYLGGSRYDAGFGIAVDIAGIAYVTGVTSSTNFLRAAPLQSAFGGGSSDAFIAKISDPVIGKQ
ncbi:MAG: SBBP repeat-containing protein [Acidobacteria bacterium]|nr:SBBP repeat-containing protein [Acidobacteriota bacterium]